MATLSEIRMKTFIIKEDDLAEAETYFRIGVHKVTIDRVELKETDSKKIYAEFDLSGEAGQKGNARLWFTDKAIKYSIDMIRKILVHNANDEAAKQAVRDEFKNVKNLLDLSAFLKRTTDCEAWLKIERSDRTYTNRDGEERFSYDRNLYGFEPVMSKEPATSKSSNAGTVEAINQAISGEVVDETEQINLDDIPF